VTINLNNVDESININKMYLVDPSPIAEKSRKNPSVLSPPESKMIHASKSLLKNIVVKQGVESNKTINKFYSPFEEIGNKGVAKPIAE
jgi:hypothetical protein